MSKEEILREIRRTAAENGGAALGIKTFERQTEIRRDDWSGIHWRSWGDAVREAGLEPNTLTTRIDEEELLRRYALLTRQLGRVPVSTDLQMARRRDSAFPSDDAYVKRFRSYAAIRSSVHSWCSGHADFADVAQLLANSVSGIRRAPQLAAAEVIVGFVYLIKHGSRSEFKEPSRRKRLLGICCSVISATVISGRTYAAKNE